MREQHVPVVGARRALPAGAACCAPTARRTAAQRVFLSLVVALFAMTVGISNRWERVKPAVGLAGAAQPFCRPKDDRVALYSFNGSFAEGRVLS
jgi:hypothetical protein